MEKVESSLTVAVYNVAGKETGTVTLPEEVFGAKINPTLMSQAVRVHLTNERQGTVNTKTRGTVSYSTRKIYKQKGTGGARHGGVGAPIFVHGGVAHGPHQQNYSLSLPQKMKRAAVLSALSAMAKDGKVKVVAGLSKVEPKTKIVATTFMGMGLNGRKAMLVMPERLDNVFRAARNLNKVTVSAASLLNTYDVLNSGTLVVMEESLEALKKMFSKKEAK